MNYLIAAYAIMWLVIFAYVFGIHRRQRKLQEELSRLQEMIDRQKP